MPIRTRHLPTNSRTVLDELVDPNARHQRTPAPEPLMSPPVKASSPQPEAAPPDRSEFEPKVPLVPDDGLPWYRRETWLVVQIAAIAPILGAMLAPAPYRLFLCVLGAAMVAAGTLMLLRHKPTPAASNIGSAS
jgi:hypothetical protein